MSELKQFCETGWSKVSPMCCAGQRHSYRKSVFVVVAAKSGLTSC